MTASTPVRPESAGDLRVTGCGSLTVLFDDGCGVCRETVRRLRRWDRGNRLEFLSLREAATSGRHLLARVAAEGHLAEEIRVVDEETGRVESGGHAALVILDALPGGWLLRPWTALPPMALAADVVWRVAERHRDGVSWAIGLRDEVTCPVRPNTVNRRTKPGS
jgi:predicted DCC family thiol-disulfide oxidoreductase YuxK